MKLDVLGLGDETERVYTTLVGLPRSSASELADASGGSTAAVSKVLAALVAKGLAIRAGSRPPRFTATPPDVAVTALIQERQRRLDAARSLVQSLAETHREALRINDPDIAVELLTHRDDISAAAGRLVNGAEHEVRAFDRPPYIDRPGSNLQHQVRRQRLGVVHRVVYSRDAMAWPGRLLDDIMPSVRAGEQARVRGELPLKLVISDDVAALIPFSLSAGGHSAAYLVHPSPMLAALEALFEAEWDRAVPLGTGGPTPVGATAAPDEETRTLLTLLTSGLTDAAIARTQGWSPRTTQRRIQRLMTALGATTRFQAALAAARRGWV
jgi:DNA-binding CsgD family transcriptional regulator